MGSLRNIVRQVMDEIDRIQGNYLKEILEPEISTLVQKLSQTVEHLKINHDVFLEEEMGVLNQFCEAIHHLAANPSRQERFKINFDEVLIRRPFEDEERGREDDLLPYGRRTLQKEVIGWAFPFIKVIVARSASITSVEGLSRTFFPWLRELNLSTTMVMQSTTTSRSSGN